MDNRLYINGIQVDLSDDIAVPITYSIADFKNPENRRRSNSRTVQLAGTKRNKELFFSAYQLSQIDTGDGLGFNINPNVRVKAIYQKNGKEVFNGLCRLLEVHIDKGNYTFEVVLFSDMVNIIKKMGDTLVSELDWSEYDHTLNMTTVQDSWDRFVTRNNVAVPNYDLITGKPLGFGYHYPWIDYGYNSSLLTKNINDLVPHLYFKETFEKCFEALGHTVDSDFFNEEMIKAITWGFGGGKKEMLPPVDVLNRKVEADFDGTQAVSTSATMLMNDPDPTQPDLYHFLGGGFFGLENFSDTVSTDPYSQYNSTTGKIKIHKSGSYNLNLDFDMLVRTLLSGGLSSNATQVQVEIWKNGSRVTNTAPQRINSGSYQNYAINKDFALTLSSGDEIEVKTYVSIIGTVSSVGTFTHSCDLDLNNDFKVTLTSSNNVYVEGDTITLSRFIPKMKCSDFVKGAITMFNLYVSEPNEDGSIKVEPLLQYYEGEEDWTHKVDHSKKISVKSPDPAKIYNFKFTQDHDYYKKKFFDALGTEYGDYQFNTNNEYNSNSKDFTVPFAQTCPVSSGGIITPRIVNIDDQTNAVTPYKGKARIYFNNGLRNGTVSVRTASGLNTFSTYPQVHHCYGNVNAPSFDLNFSKPEQVFYYYQKYQNKNLFSQYHRISIVEQSSIDSKILKAFFKLDASDIYTDMFRTLVNINGVLYRKNLINDFDANGNVTTQVELYKVLETTEEIIQDPREIPVIISMDHVPLISSPRFVGEGSPILSGGIASVMQERPVLMEFTPTPL